MNSTWGRDGNEPSKEAGEPHSPSPTDRRHGLGFKDDQIDGDVGALPGGWKMCVALARACLHAGRFADG